MNAVSDLSKSSLSSFMPGKSSLTTAERVARGLGWFSIALGVVEIVAPGKLTRALGLEGKENLVRAYGAREIGAGIGALSVDPGPALWSRLGGDAIDVATLALGLKGDDRQRKFAIGAMAAVVAIAAVDLIAASKLSAERARKEEPRSFSTRSGFPGGVHAARGLAADFQTPRELRAELPRPA